MQLGSINNITRLMYCKCKTMHHKNTELRQINVLMITLFADISMDNIDIFTKKYVGLKRCNRIK